MGARHIALRLAAGDQLAQVDEAAARLLPRLRRCPSSDDAVAVESVRRARHIALRFPGRDQLAQVDEAAPRLLPRLRSA